MALKVAINGMGVIGREMLRTLWGQEGIEIVLINDVSSVESMVYLLKFDSIYHRNYFVENVSTDGENLIINGKSIVVYHCADPQNIPLGAECVDITLECTGIFNNQEKLHSFIDAGTKRVISCYFAGTDLPTIAPDVNKDVVKSEDDIISIPPMELQVVAQMLNIFRDSTECCFTHAFRSFTNAQYTLDSYSNDAIMGRSGPLNITPNKSNSSSMVGLVIPELSDKVTGREYRSPVANGSIMDITIKYNGATSIGDLKEIFKTAAEKNKDFGYSEDLLCSSDSMSYDVPQLLAKSINTYDLNDKTMLINFSVVYDNIHGYCNLVQRFLQWAKGNWC